MLLAGALLGSIWFTGKVTKVRFGKKGAIVSGVIAAALLCQSGLALLPAAVAGFGAAVALSR